MIFPNPSLPLSQCREDLSIQGRNAVIKVCQNFLWRSLLRQPKTGRNCPNLFE